MGGGGDFTVAVVDDDVWLLVTLEINPDAFRSALDKIWSMYIQER